MCAADIDDTNECWEDATCRVYCGEPDAAYFSAWACDEHAPEFFAYARRKMLMTVHVERLA